MSAADTALVVVDVQVKLMPLIPGAKRIIWNLGRLIEGAETLGVKILATEQYPQGLGPTLPELASHLGQIPAKSTFSCCGCEPFFQRLTELGASKVLVSGIETHVCVQQTVLDLLAGGYRVYVPVDAVGSRYRIDFETGLRRMESAGATLTTTESAPVRVVPGVGHAAVQEDQRNGARDNRPTSLDARVRLGGRRASTYPSFQVVV